MNVRHLMAALAVPCACIAADRAAAQDRSAYGPQPSSPQSAAQPQPAEARLPVLAEPRRGKITMIESWQVGDKAEFGLGRFSVGEIARPRTNTERVRDDFMARENRAIAGAGLRLRFR